MRLLNVNTRRLEEFFGDTIPRYAILSHTWGQEEVTFQDLAREDHKQKHGYRKIEGCCQAAAEQQTWYVWVDTCCIDKSSSAELSEAINSMFKWYEESEVCFIYLEDVPTGLDPFSPESAFRKSRWWTRGWTLQELLAPQYTIFFDSTWERLFMPEMSQGLFKKIVLPVSALKDPQQRSEQQIQPIIEQVQYRLLTEITGIPSAVLVKELQLSQVSAACKFAWASQRMTTRTEDKAYCLMGLLGVNMPLLYGEGDKAFVRLQEAVISSSDDISLLAWGHGLAWEDIEELGYDKILARSPTAFRGYPKSNYQHIRRPPKTHSTVTGHGLHIELPLLLINAENRVWIGIIEEGSDENLDDNVSIALVLKQKSLHDTHVFERARGCPVLKIMNLCNRKRHFRNPVPKMVYLQDGAITSTSTTMEGSLDLPHSLYSSLTSIRKSTHRHQYTAELAIFIKSFRNVGYTLSSQYPPIDHGMISLFTREAHKGEPGGGDIKSQYELPFESLLCPGPGNEQFYFILTNTEGHRVAIKVRIKYKPPYIDSYKVSLSHCDSGRHVTALEYACDAGVGTHTFNQLREKMLWNSYINLWSPTTTKINVSACPSQQYMSNNVRFAQCSLVWSGGWVSE
jgi:hypothetical protein